MEIYIFEVPTAIGMREVGRLVLPESRRDAGAYWTMVFALGVALTELHGGLVVGRYVHG